MPDRLIAEQTFPQGVVALGDRRADRLAGVVDQNLDRAEHRARSAKRGVHGFPLGDVRGCAEGLRTGGSQFRREPSSVAAVRPSMLTLAP